MDSLNHNRQAGSLSREGDGPTCASPCLSYCGRIPKKRSCCSLVIPAAAAKWGETGFKQIVRKERFSSLHLGSLEPIRLPRPPALSLLRPCSSHEVGGDWVAVPALLPLQPLVRVSAPLLSSFRTPVRALCITVSGRGTIYPCGAMRRWCGCLVVIRGGVGMRGSSVYASLSREWGVG